jgi:hypothetical protein
MSNSLFVVLFTGQAAVGRIAARNPNQEAPAAPPGTHQIEDRRDNEVLEDKGNKAVENSDDDSDDEDDSDDDDNNSIGSSSDRSATGDENESIGRNNNESDDIEALQDGVNQMAVATTNLTFKLPTLVYKWDDADGNERCSIDVMLLSGFTREQLKATIVPARWSVCAIRALLPRNVSSSKSTRASLR